MDSLIVAYLIAWAVVAGYVGWMAAANRCLARRLDDIEGQIAEADTSRSRSKVA